MIKQHDWQGNKHGVKVLFPVEVKRKYLKWMTRGHYKQRIVQKAQRFEEVIQFKILKSPNLYRLKFAWVVIYDNDNAVRKSLDHAA